MYTWVVLAAIVAAFIAAFALLVGRTSPKYLALWEILGGVSILAGWMISASQGYAHNWQPITILSSLSVAALAIVAGLLLWRRRVMGTKLSLVAQALQLAWVSLPAAQFGSTLGPTIGPRLTSNSFTLNIGFYGRGGLVVGAGTPFPLDITVNVLAIIALVGLFRMLPNSYPRSDEDLKSTANPNGSVE